MSSSPSSHSENTEIVLYQSRVGQLLSGKWTVTALIGVGGMAVVYEATHRNGKRLAVKVLKREFAEHGDARQRFLAEGYRANRVDHPSVVHALDDGVTDDGLPFLVMDRLHGESLDQRMRRAPLSELEVLLVGDRVLSVLTTAQEAGITHRDLKPDNLFLTEQREIKLLDFGIAKAAEEAQNNDRTAIGSIMGTPSYMPPEQAMGQWDQVDARSDVFSLGAAMIALLTGRAPREGVTVNYILVAAMRDPLPSVAVARPDLHPKIVALIDRAVAFDRTKRFESAADMRRDLHAVWGEIASLPIAAAHTSMFKGGPERVRESREKLRVVVTSEPSANGPTGTAYIGSGSNPSGPYAIAPRVGSNPSFGALAQGPTGRSPSQSNPHEHISQPVHSLFASAPPQALSVLTPPARSKLPVILAGFAIVALLGIGGGAFAVTRARAALKTQAFAQVGSVAAVGSAASASAPLGFSDLPSLPPVVTTPHDVESSVSPPSATTTAPPVTIATTIASANPSSAPVAPPPATTTTSTPHVTRAASTSTGASTASTTTTSTSTARKPAGTSTGADPFDRRY